MKNILLLMALTLIATYAFKSDAMELEAKPILSLGHRFGDQELNGDGAFYVSAKMTTLTHEIADFKTLNFMALGINYQDDRKWAASISPISISTLSGLTVGVDYIPKTKNVDGDILGIFLGIKID